MRICYARATASSAVLAVVLLPAREVRTAFTRRPSIGPFTYECHNEEEYTRDIISLSASNWLKL